MAEQLAVLNKGEEPFRYLTVSGQSASFTAGGEKTITFDFSSQMSDGEKIISVCPNSTGVVGLAIRTININTYHTSTTVTWRNVTTSTINTSGLGCLVVVARF